METGIASYRLMNFERTIYEAMINKLNMTIWRHTTNTDYFISLTLINWDHAAYWVGFLFRLISIVSNVVGSQTFSNTWFCQQREQLIMPEYSKDRPIHSICLH